MGSRSKRKKYPRGKLGTVVLLFITAFALRQTYLGVHAKVLGISTYLADNDGNNGNGNGNTTPTPTTEPTIEPTPTATPELTPTITPTPTFTVIEEDRSQAQTIPNEPVTESTLVQCVGPDGHLFETEYEDCLQLSREWSQPVVYTVAPQRTSAPTTTTRQSTPTPISRTGTTVRRPQAVPTKTGEPGTAASAGDIFMLRSTGEAPIIPFEEGKLRVWSEDRNRRVNLTKDGVKTKIDFEDGEFVLKSEAPDGQEVKLAAETLSLIDNRLKLSGIKLASASGQWVVLEHGNTGAVTNFPILVDLSAGTLSINTSEGERLVAVLPDEAVTSLFDLNAIYRLGVSTNADNDVESQQVVGLNIEDGTPVYQIVGLSSQKLFNFLPIDISGTFSISAEDGTFVSMHRPFLMNILDTLSF